MGKVKLDTKSEKSVDVFMGNENPDENTALSSIHSVKNLELERKKGFIDEHKSLNTKPFDSKIGVVAGIAIFLAIVGIIFFILFNKNLQDFLGTEIFKLSYQFLLLVVIGGAVSLIFTEYTKAKEQRLKDTEKDEERKLKEKEKWESKNNEERILQHKFYNDFIQAYDSAKKIRRLLRSRARILSQDAGTNSEAIVIKTLRYDEQMQVLTNVQLQFEFFCEEVQSNRHLFSGVDELKNLSQDLKKIESYLNKIVGEYEDCYKSLPNQSFIDDVPTIPIKNLPKLGEFIGKYENATSFKTEFKKPAKNVVAGLQKLLTSEKKVDFT